MTAAADARRWVREKPQLIADDLRGLILSGEVGDGASLGRETELVARYGVSRPCLREALRILETEGLVTVARGARGGVTAHLPDRRIAARMAAMLLQTRNVSLADVHGARAYIEPLAARVLAERRSWAQAVRQLGRLVEDQEASVGDPPRFGAANAAFHHELVALAGNQTLGILTEVLDEIVVRSVDVAGLAGDSPCRPAAAPSGPNAGSSSSSPRATDRPPSSTGGPTSTPSAPSSSAPTPPTSSTPSPSRTDVAGVRVVDDAAMHVLALEVELHINGSQSLKDKRQVIRSILDGARRRYGVASAEVGGQDTWQRAVLGFAAVGSSVSHVEDVIDEVERFVWSHPEAEVVGTTRRWLDDA